MHRARTMSAAILAAPAQARVEKVALSGPEPGFVRVRLEGCGGGGSNLGPWEGKPWFKYPFPAGEPGHEGWGVIDALGPDVSTVKCGDRVAVLSYRAFAEYDMAPADAVVPLPASLRGKPFPGEALGCAMNVFRRCQISPGQSVAILGIGFLGAILTQLAVNAGAVVIAISRRPFALELATAFGAQHTIPMDDHNRIIAEVKALPNGQGCHCVIEAVGQQWPLDLAAELTRERGR